MANGGITPLTTKYEIQYHLLQWNHQAYWMAGNTPFVHTSLGRALGPTGDPPLPTPYWTAHSNLAVRAFTTQLRL
jgi:hypothetical protein